MIYWGGVDEIILPSFEVKNILAKAQAVKGVSGAIKIGDLFYISSWNEKSIGVCKFI